jgi:hypothetical protein
MFKKAKGSNENYSPMFNIKLIGLERNFSYFRAFALRDFAEQQLSGRSRCNLPFFEIGTFH